MPLGIATMKLVPFRLPDGGLTAEEFEEALEIIFPTEEDLPPPSLFDIFDDEEHEAAVDAIFPPSLVPETPSPSEVSSPIDLSCHETVPSTPESEIESVPSASALPASSSAATPAPSGPPENVDYVLDYPEVPGEGCKSCEFHRKKAEKGDIKCSLCYMRLTSVFVYSKYRFYMF